MDDIAILERVFERRAGRRRPVGKPQKRWEDSIGEDSVSLLGFKNWRRIVGSIWLEEEHSEGQANN